MMQLHMLPAEITSMICSFLRRDWDPQNFFRLRKDEETDFRSLRGTCKVCIAVDIMLFRKLVTWGHNSCLYIYVLTKK
jgi:hypothetical protein